MKIIRCDRCGKEYDRKKDQHGKLYIQKEPTYWGGEVLTHKFDLCPECADEIVKFIINEEKQEENVEDSETNQTN